MADLSPNSRIAGQFPAGQQQKPHQRIVVGMPTGNQQFQLPMSRAVSVQIAPGINQLPRQQSQHRIIQSPFSPQSQTPQSPHDQYPSSPATSTHDQFSRPASECSQDTYLNVSRLVNTNVLKHIHINSIHILFPSQSPQTPRSFGHQSPTANASHSPAYAGQQSIPQSPNAQNSMRLNIANNGSYKKPNSSERFYEQPASNLNDFAQAPGTPRPNFATDTIRPTVYATNQTSPYSSPGNEQFTQPIQENNRQLRDLLQRQQMVAPNQQQVPGEQQGKHRSTTRDFRYLLTKNKFAFSTKNTNKIILELTK